MSLRVSILRTTKFCLGTGGEKTAARLESNLTSLEKKIDDLLASFEESERLKVEEANGEKRTNPGGEHGGDEVGKS